MKRLLAMLLAILMAFSTPMEVLANEVFEENLISLETEAVEEGELVEDAVVTEESELVEETIMTEETTVTEETEVVTVEETEIIEIVEPTTETEVSERIEVEEIMGEGTELSATFGYEKVSGGIRIISYNGTDSELVIPETYDDYTVKEIGANAFKNNTILTSVVIPDTVVKIGSSAFAGCSDFTICTFKDAWIITYAEENNIPYEIVTLPIEAITLTAPQSELKMNETLQLNPTVKPGLYSDKLTWSTSDKAIATVSKDGLVTAGTKAGEVTITVTADSGVSASCTINVVIPFCNITYHLDGGTNDAGNPDIFYITDATFALKNASKDGYTFGGWYSDILGLKKVTEIEAGKTGNVTLYARWTKIK